MDVNVNELRDHVDRRERAQPAIGQRDLCHCWECAFSSSVIISCIPTSVMLPAPSDLHLSNTYMIMYKFSFKGKQKKEVAVVTN
ncbi:unnamed protein product [Prunus brigantina]